MTEPLDRNKTALTHVATATTAAWLDGVGVRPVETEVPLGAGWVADLAGVWSPTLTEARKTRLLREIFPQDDPQEQAYDALFKLGRRYGGRLTVVVEVKTSRADFLADRGRKYATYGGSGTFRATLSPPAHLCILAAPLDVIRDDEHLVDWTHLRLSADCSRVVKRRGFWEVNRLHPYEIEDLILAVAIRRDNHTRYQSMRRLMKSYRAKESK